MPHKRIKKAIKDLQRELNEQECKLVLEDIKIIHHELCRIFPENSPLVVHLNKAKVELEEFINEGCKYTHRKSKALTELQGADEVCHKYKVFLASLEMVF